MELAAGMRRNELKENDRHLTALAPMLKAVGNGGRENRFALGSIDSL